MKPVRTPLLIGAAVVAVAVVSLILLLPKPIAVQSAPVSFGPLQVTVEDQAETRSHDRYVVAAPVAGRLQRVLLRDGDAVTAGQAVAVLAPVPLSARERDETIARVDAAAATGKSAQAQLRRAQEDLAQARRELTRLSKLATEGLASAQALDQARTQVATLGMEVAAARHRRTSAEAQLRGARAALSAVTQMRSGRAVTVTVHAPAGGRVLRVLEPSARVIGSGTPIMVIGDLTHLEVVAEMLTSQAVKVAPGMPALLLDWGGDHPLRARVERVEPYGFTKISALGVEEKRSNVILAFVDSPGALGDGYRVIARIIVWQSARVLRAPLSAIFRCDSKQWCAYVIDHDRARLRHILIGHHNDDAVEILGGLKDGERVITHPPNEITDGARVSTPP